MKQHKKAMCLLLILVIAVSLASCGTQGARETAADTTGAVAQEPVTRVVFSEKFLNVAENSPEDWVESLIKFSQGQYTDIYVNEDRLTVTMEITREQADSWKERVDSWLTVLQSNFAAVDPSYQIVISGDYSHIDFYYDLNLPAEDAVYYVINVEVYCAFRQLLNGAGADDWKVFCDIYNSGTGKLVTSGDSDTGMSYEASDWEASE